MITRFGVPSERIRLLPNTAPTGYFPLTPEQAPEYASLLPQDGFRLMFAGNIGESQDFDTLTAAATLLRDRRALHWVIIGSGRDEEPSGNWSGTGGWMRISISWDAILKRQCPIFLPMPTRWWSA